LALVISTKESSQPNLRHIIRNGGSVIPAMGARIRDESRVNEPIFSIRYFIWNIRRGQTTDR
jgi:hypothetical protein